VWHDARMDEVLPGIVHWSVVHPNTGMPAHSHYLVETHTVLDPMVPAEGLGWFERLGDPERVVLTNRHHLRDAERFADAYGCPILVHPEGFHEFVGGPVVEPLEPGDEPAPGVRVREVGAICPDEVALHIAEGPGALGDDPEAVKSGLRAAYRRLCDELEFDVLLLAHGDPIPSGGRAALAAFVGG
jgi:hypothetical protein